MADDTTSGSTFYGDADRVDRYLQHRHGSAGSPNLTMEQPAFLDAVGDSAGLDVVELGCGDGSFASTAVAAGCRSYIGVDRSAPMLHACPAAPGGDVRRLFNRRRSKMCSDQRRARTLWCRGWRCWPGHRGAERSWLAPAGWPSRLHRSAPGDHVSRHRGVDRRQSWVVDGYFEPGPRTRIWRDEPVVWQHRTIEQYVAALIAADLAATSLSECAARRPAVRRRTE